MWKEYTLNEVCDVERGSSPRPIKQFTTENDGVNWIKIGDTVQGEKYVSSTKEKITKEGAEKSRYVSAGDLILTNSMSYGRPYIMATDGYIHDGWFVLRLKEFIDAEYFYHLLSSTIVQKQFNQLAAGSVVKNISGDLVKKVTFSLPPLAEQQSIVAKLDAAFAEIDGAVAASDEAAINLRSLRSILYEQIIIQNCSSYTEYTLKEIVAENCSLSYGIVQPGEDVPSGLPIVRPVDMHKKFINIKLLKRINPLIADGYKRTTLEGNELLMSVRGSTGIISVTSDALEGANVTRGIIPIRFNSQLVERDFGYYAMLSHKVQKQISDATYGAALQQINVKDVKQIKVAIPAIPEQKNIIDILNKIDKSLLFLERCSSQKMANITSLKSAILAKELQGEAVMWKTVKLGDVCDLVGGGTPSKKNDDYYDGDIPWATVRDMNVEELTVTEHKITELGLKNSSSKVIPANNVIIASRVGLGKVCILRQDTAINQDLRGVIPKRENEIDKSFLFYWFKGIANKIIGAGRGATVQGVTLPFLNSLSFPLPPLAEQQRIVAKLDAAFAEIDGAITTSKAQAENMSSLKKKFISNALTIDVQAKPLGDCCAFLNGYAFKSGDAVETSETQLLRMGNLYENRLDLERKPVFYPDEYANQHSRYVLAKDDILMTLTGTVGKQDYGYALKIGDTEKTLLLNQRILKLYDFNSTVINQEYLLYFLQSESFLAELYATANGTRQANLSSDTIKKLKIPVPSLDKQEKAVAAFKLMDDYHHQFFECLMEKISNLSTLKSALLAQELQSEAA